MHIHLGDLGRVLGDIELSALQHLLRVGPGLRRDQ